MDYESHIKQEDDNDCEDDYLEEFPKEPIDTTQFFISNLTFKNRKDLISEARKKGLANNILVRVGTSHQRRGFGEQWLKCDRSDKYHCRAKLDVPSNKSFTGSKKCDCPFRLKGVRQLDGTWKLYVHNGNHNHNIEERVPPLDDVTKETILRMTASKISVSNILIDLAKKGIYVTAKQVYNVRAKEKQKLRENRTASKQLLKLAVSHGYRVFHETIPAKSKGTSELTDVLFAHPESINLLKQYPYVLLADSTYNTNKYKMPLLEVIGVTPVHKNFSVFFAFLQNEKEAAYDWALKCMREVIDSDGRIVFLTDRELALIKAIEKHFPTSTHLLCRRHIQKDVEAWVKNKLRNGSIGEAFAKGKWTQLVRSTTEKDFLERLEAMFEIYDFVPGLEKYCKETWLNPYKEKFVSVWTNKVLHFGNVTTNRVEGAHSALKRLLRTSVGGFDTVFETIHHVVNLQIREINRELGRSKTIALHISKAMSVYRRLTLNVSHHTIKILDRAFSKTIDCNGCVLKTTHGLPCACEILRLVNADKCIELDLIHPFWKKLDYGSWFQQNNDDTMLQEQNRLRKLIDVVLKGDVELMKKVSNYMENMLHPPNIIDPEVRKTRGRPKKTSVSRDPSYWEHVEKKLPKKSWKREAPENSVDASTICTSFQVEEKSQNKSRKRVRIPTESLSPSQVAENNTAFPYATEIPYFMVSSVKDWKNVRGDGNCGFRAIAHEIYGDEKEWLKVRRDLLSELLANRQFYVTLFDSEKEVNDLVCRVSHWEGPAPRTHWMCTDIGFVVANRYDVIYTNLSLEGSSTFLPMKRSSTGQKKFVTTILVVSIDHFMWACLAIESPLPTVHPLWRHHVDKCCSKVYNQIEGRVQLYKSLLPIHSIPNSPIVFDDV